jgi:hypothetical protein
MDIMPMTLPSLHSRHRLRLQKQPFVQDLQKRAMRLVNKRKGGFLTKVGVCLCFTRC